MIKVNAHIGFLFSEMPFLERFHAAAAAGFRAVEFPSPYEYEPTQLAEALSEHQLKMVQFAAPHAGTKGTTGICTSRPQFREQLRTAVQYAKALDCNMVHLMSGVSLPDLNVTADRECYRLNLSYAADYLLDEGITPLIEVISATEVSGYLMADFTLAEQMLEHIPHLGLILDTYHTELLGHDSLSKLDQCWAQIRHIQIADFPGRHEPGTGRLDFKKLIGVLQAGNYQGWLGCEYGPLHSTSAGLAALWEVLAPPTLIGLPLVRNRFFFVELYCVSLQNNFD